MKWELILSNLGRIILIVGIAMFACIPWSIADHDGVTIAIALAAGLTVISGLLLTNIFKTEERIGFKEAYLIVSLGWVVASAFGSLPYLFSGYLPSLADAWFETVSGFTTTGATVVADVESWPRGLLFWRSLTQWLGGMGIIVLLVAVIANLGVRANQLFRAEVPGPISDKISPRIRESARKLWLAYVFLSLACAILLYIFGMDVFDSLCHTFATMATGGFSTKNTSIAYYASPAIQWTITFFMFIAGVSFTLHYLAFKQRKPLLYWKNPEFRLYTVITGVACLLVVLSLWSTGTAMGWEEKIRVASFQVVSMMTTTGFATADYNYWPSLASGVLFMMMFVGGCSGSTAGNIKPGRYLIIGSRTVIELKKMLHPRAMLSLRFGGRVIDDDLLTNVLQFFFLYIAFLAMGTIVMNALGMDILSGLTASATCLGNIGPGFNLVGPTQNFAFVPDIGKYVLSILMLVGRLEIYPILVLLLPAYWKE